MTEKNEFTVSGIVNGLIQAVIDCNISISPIMVHADLENASLSEVLLKIGEQQFTCVTDNEYGDMSGDNIPLMLNMILSEIENYHEADDFLTWASSHEIDASSKKVRHVWDDLTLAAAEISKLLPADIKGISSWDWQLNAGEAHILRGLPKKYRKPNDS